MSRKFTYYIFWFDGTITRTKASSPMDAMGNVGLNFHTSIEGKDYSHIAEGMNMEDCWDFNHKMKRWERNRNSSY